MNQEHSFGNGPVVLLSKEEDQWIIDAYSPTWMNSESIHLISQEGIERASWEMNDASHVSVSYPIEEYEWVLAEVRGEHWAISPIFIRELESED